MKTRLLAAMLITALLALVCALAWLLLTHSAMNPPLGAGVLVQRKARNASSTTLILDRLQKTSKLITLSVECLWEERLRQTTEIRFWPDATETVFAIIYGQVTYGIDLSELKDEGVQASPDGKVVTIRLPPIRKTGVRVDLERSRVLGHEYPWYWPRDSSLREAVLAEAEARLTKAEPADVVKKARDQAESVVADLVRRTAGNDVEVRFVESASPEKKPVEEDTTP